MAATTTKTVATHTARARGESVVVFAGKLYNFHRKTVSVTLHVVKVLLISQKVPVRVRFIQCMYQFVLGCFIY